MRKILVLIIMLMNCTVVLADNAFVSYFKRWIDETRVELAIGNLLLNQFTQDLPKEYNFHEDEILSGKFTAFIEKCGVKTGGVKFKVMVIESEIPDEILLPGGILIVTRGYLQHALKPEQQDFILARNAFLSFRKQPLVVIKHEGMYPKFLDSIKLSDSKNSKKKVQDLLKAYLAIVSKMNHKQADVQGALLTSNPDETRKSAIEMMSGFSVQIWPPLPFGTVDLPSRIAELKEIKLPQQKL